VQRRQRGWDVATMARQLANAAGDLRHTLPSKECMLVYIRRWERGDVGVSERYTMLYCTAFGIELSQFGPHPERTATAAPPSTRQPEQATIRLRDLRDHLRDDAKHLHHRATQSSDPVTAALCRGQAMAYEMAAEYTDAVLTH
jgi:hypothetical protein